MNVTMLHALHRPMAFTVCIQNKGQFVFVTQPKSVSYGHITIRGKYKCLLLNKLIMIMLDKSISLLTFTSHIDCTISNFKNGNLSHSNFDTVGMEETHSDEKHIVVPCKLGHTGMFKIKCSRGLWTKVFGDICIRKFIFVFVVYIFTMLQYYK